MQSAAPKEMPKPRPIVGLPGSQIDAKDAWMGGAGKELAQLKDQVKKGEEERLALRGDLRQAREQFSAEMTALRERGFLPPAPIAPPAASPLTPLQPMAPAAQMTPPSPAALGAAPVQPAPAPTAQALRAPMSFPSQRGDRLPAPGGTQAYPPGTPNGMAGGVGQPVVLPQPESLAPTMMRVSLGGTKTTDAAPARPNGEGAGAGAGGAVLPGQARVKTVSNFLPVGFTRAVLLGGLAAPTGGQAQSNPVPVLLRLADLAVLPNGFRGQVKDCLVIGEGFGDHSAERAYIRATLLSCVMRDGQVLEVPIKGSVFGEDGMNGMMGKLITKQGAILGNALLAGIASGIGSGISQASQVVTTTSLGSVSTNPTDTSSILKQGFGTGVGKALDRLAQYYITLAERTFPIIEIQPGRIVDVVIQQGVGLDVALAAIGPGATGQTSRGEAPDNDRSALMRAVRGEDDE